MYFEDLEIWKSARTLTNMIYKITSDGNFSKDFGLRDQIRRASVSIMSNIAEGYARGGNKEFVQFMFISKASASELQSHLYLSLDLSYISQDNFNTAYEQLDKVQRKLSSFIKVLRNNPKDAITQ